MQNDRSASDAVRSRFEFYRDGFRLALVVILVSVLGHAAQAWRDLYAYLYPTPPRILAVDDSNRLKDVVPLNEPRMTDADIQAWTVSVINRVCNINWLTYRQELNDAQPSFTVAGWNGLESEFLAKKIPQALQHDRLQMSCTLTRPALIRRKGTLDGALVYDIEMPYLLGYYGQDNDRDRFAKAIITAQVVQVSTAKYARGVAIAAVQFTPDKESLDGE